MKHLDHMTNVVLPILMFSILLNAQQKKSDASVHESAAQADLVVVLTHPMSGTIVVKNVGTAQAGPTKLTLDCIKAGVSAKNRLGGCPLLPPSAAPLYFDSAFPQNATVQVPALAPGESFTHTLSFWTELKWTPGKYTFIAVADATHSIKESSKKNHTATSTLTVP